MRAAYGDDPLVSRPFTPPGPADDDLVCTLLDRPAAPDDAETLAAWAAAVLSPDEIETWKGFRLPKRRREWLMGRIAAKEAVRIRLMRPDCSPGPAGDHPPAPSRRQIVVRGDARGRPCVVRPPGSDGPDAPASEGPAIVLSIAHTEGVAVAAVSTRAAGIGIDVERLERRGDYESAAFTDDERRRLDAGPPERRAERSLRLFCAKEAAAKATGLGLMGSPHNLHLVACDAELDRVTLRAAGRLAKALPDGARDRAAVAWIGVGAGLVIALSQRDAHPPS